MDERDMALLAALEDGIPFVPDPYGTIGKTVGMTGDEVLRRITGMRDSGIIRKFRARINQRRIGVVANALVAWNCNGHSAEEKGAVLAAFPGVTHCYERQPVPGRWEYTLYTVHHGFSRREVEEEVRMIAKKTGLEDYCIMFSTEEYKRVPNVRIGKNGGVP